jgi:hypothetical protein
VTVNLGHKGVTQKLTATSLLATILLQTIGVCAQQNDERRLADGTKVALRLVETLSSATAKDGDIITFEVLEDVVVGDKVVIKQGATANGVVIDSQAKRRMGRAGRLSYKVTETKSVDHQSIRLRATKEGSGDSHATGVAVTTAAVAVFVPVAAPFFLLRKGKDLVVPQGTRADAYIDGEQVLATEVPTVGHGAVALTGQTLSNEDVMALHRAGFGDELIIAKISSSHAAFNVAATNLMELKNAGLSEKVITAMLNVTKQR